MCEVLRCSKCVLSESFPGIKIDKHGVCNYCRDSLSLDEMNTTRDELKAKMSIAIDTNRNISEYDAIVAFSGGKDSSFTLKMLVEKHDLNCLAVTVDNGFLSDKALDNCRAITGSLGVDFMLFTPAPDFMMNMYRQSVSKDGKKLINRSALKRASAICNSCINLINNVMVKLALQHNCRIIAGGYIGGQIPSGAAVLNIDLLEREGMKKHLKDTYQNLYGKKADKFFYLRNDELKKYNPDKPLIVINPMLTLAISEEQIIDSIKKLGWVKTTDTGMNSSNCKLNDLGIALHYKEYQFHPYEAEIAEQVRYGIMDRQKALDKIKTIPQFDKLDWQMKKIGILINNE
ncbi:MAG: hypothetical protein OQL19_20915 [Gammaproteobacteria bacterium]|nr:hypothetical protein [Gammaproteobacteria bacterium]